MATSLNRRWFTVASAPGTGDVAAGSALAGYLGLGAAQDGMTFDGVTFLDGSAWEVRNGCTYTHGTTTLTRGTLEESSTGSAISLSASTTVMLSVSAGTLAMLDVAMQSVIPGGRLTTESGVPVSTSDRTAQSTIYYTPFVHNTVPLWDGAQWKPVKFTETSLALSGLTSGRPYDVFGYVSSGVLALELLAWTNDTTRATAVTLQDGRYCKSGDKTRLLLGTIYTTGTTTTEDSLANRYVANLCNTASKPMSHSTNDVGHSYTLGTPRPYNNSTTHRVNFVSPAVAAVTFLTGGNVNGTSAGDAEVTYAVDSIVTSSANVVPLNSANTASIRAAGGGFEVVDAGKHFVQLMERNRPSTGTAVFSYAVLRGQVPC